MSYDVSFRDRLMKSMKKEDFESRCYEAYKLDWMISHGYSLRDYLNAIIQEDEEARAAGDYPEGDTDKIFETLNDSFEERGFGGSLWACKDEFLESEFQDEAYMEHLFSVMPKSKEMEEFWRVFYNKSRTVRPAIEVETSAGVLRAYKTINPEMPGIYVTLQPAGEEEIVSYSSIHELTGAHTAEAEIGEITVTSSLPEESGDISIMTITELYEALETTAHDDPTRGYSSSTFFVYAINDTGGTDDSSFSTVANLKAVGTKWYHYLNRPTKNNTHWTVGTHKLFGGPLSSVYRCIDGTYCLFWYHSVSNISYSHNIHYWDSFISGSVYVAVVHR